MAFEGLTEKLQGALRKLSSKGKLTEDNVKEGMREVRMALLEADVNYAVAKDFIKKVTARCVGTEITGTLSASQQVIKIVNEEMTQLMGGENARLTWSSGPLTVYMLCGLQGAGKTTMAAKLANYLAKQGKKPVGKPEQPCRTQQQKQPLRKRFRPQPDIRQQHRQLWRFAWQDSRSRLH